MRQAQLSDMWLITIHVAYVLLLLSKIDKAVTTQTSKSKLGIIKTQPNSIYKMVQDATLDSMEHNVLVGGVASRIYKHPYAASIMKDSQYVCGAAVLNKNWILTHVHCIANNTSTTYLIRAYLNQFTIRVGSNFNNKGGNIHKVKLVKLNSDHNFALIKLSTPMEMNKKVKAINLPEFKMLDFGTTVEVSGWTISGHIRIIKMPILASSLCYNSEESLKVTLLRPDKFVCMGGIDDLPVGHNNVCRRDSGNPIVQNGYLLAVVPHSSDCIQYKTVQPYPRVYSITRWLDSVIWDEEKKSNYWDKPNQYIPLDEHYSTPRLTAKTKSTEKSPASTTQSPLSTTRHKSVSFIDAKPGLSLYEAYLKSLRPTSTSDIKHQAYGQSSQEYTRSTVANSRVYLNAPAIPTDEWAKRYSQDLRRLQEINPKEAHKIVTAKYDNLKQLEKRMEFYNRNFA